MIGSARLFFAGLTLDSGPPLVEIFNEPFGINGTYSSGSPATPNVQGFGPQSSIRRPPTGWTFGTNSLNDDIYFLTAASSSNVTCSVPGSSGGTQMCMFRYSGYGSVWVKTKSISTIGYENVSLFFNIFDDFGMTADLYPKMSVEYSLNNSTWNVLSYSIPDESGNTFDFQPVHRINIPAANNQATLYIRFTIDDDGSFNALYMDDIVVKGSIML